VSFDATIVQLINEGLVNEFELEPALLTPEARFVEDLSMDSLDLLDMVLLLQNTLGVELREDKRIRQVRSLGNLYTLIATIKAEKVA
jgi:acyl carrier protein